LVSDVLEICTYPLTRAENWNVYEHKGPVNLCYATTAEAEVATDREWQRCAQGYVSIEAIA